ncbi:MAG: DUF2784 domain-containing protein [Bryobacteraceae bacterium]|nr:DUF2784 domain-containing protein [Bryobacteraceae bacterium]
MPGARNDGIGLYHTTAGRPRRNARTPPFTASLAPPHDGRQVYRLLAAAVLIIHLLWILWVIFGALFTRRRPLLAWAHVISLVYSIAIEIAAFPCPLTSLEQWTQARAGLTPYEGDFLVHYLEAVIYPNIPYPLLVACAVAVCLFNLGIYALRARRG